MIAQLSSGHVDAADALFLLAVILFGIALVLQFATSTAQPRWLNGITFLIGGLLSIALALFVL